MTRHPQDARSSPAALVRQQVDGDVWLVELADPERHNALGPSMVVELRSALGAAPQAAALVLSGEGRHFCSGGDHDELAALDRNALRTYLANVSALFAEVASCASPVVAHVHGGVVGGGLDLALACDFIVANDDAWFQSPQVKLGVRIWPATSAVLTARTGLSFARRFTLLGERVTAEQAAAAGLVDIVASTAEGSAAALGLARQLAEQPPDSLLWARSTMTRAIGARPPSASEE